MGEAAHQEVQAIQERASSARRRSRNQGGPAASSYSSYMSYTSYRDACWHVADVPGVQGERRGAVTPHHRRQGRRPGFNHRGSSKPPNF